MIDAAHTIDVKYGKQTKQSRSKPQTGFKTLCCKHYTGIRGFFSNSLKLRILSNKNEASLRDFILDPKTKYQE